MLHLVIGFILEIEIKTYDCSLSPYFVTFENIRHNSNFNVPYRSFASYDISERKSNKICANPPSNDKYVGKRLLVGSTYVVFSL